MKIAVIGGGAAGFFAAITAKVHDPHAELILFEKTRKPLSKVKISGGGRCNVTNGSDSIRELVQAYPRGGKVLKKLLPRFNNRHIMEWFQNRGIGLVTEADGRVFPDTHRSSTIVNCLMEEFHKVDARLELGKGVQRIHPRSDGFQLGFRRGEVQTFDRVIVASGGSPERKGLEWLERSGHSIESPVPSLFTFNMPEERITELAGISIEEAEAKVQGSAVKAKGALLITHWGMSGPAILKLSAFGARELYDRAYRFQLQVNWVQEKNEERVREGLRRTAESHSAKQLRNRSPFGLPQRLWEFLLERAEFPRDKPWGELGKKSLHKLVDLLTRDVYEVRGKSTFKEEFVTCGGVALDQVRTANMESKVHPGLFFAGEVLNIDAITGGYNFQAAWTTGYIAGLSSVRKGGGNS
ncbi:MAG: NAD(P)/FAD-dependent oxidoreductase [Flavobacteriales bacterium]